MRSPTLADGGRWQSQEDIEYGLNFAERILSGRYVSADQMIDWYEEPAEGVDHPAQ